MELKEKVHEILATKKDAGQYLDEVRGLLPELQAFMSCVLKEQDPKNAELIQYLIGILQDTVAGVENRDEVLLLDVLEYGWLELIESVMGETESDNI